jgi:2-oxoglutarate ferredoxin oxidoreductase subunit alpha
MCDKRLRKIRYLTEELNQYDLVKTYGDKDSSTALLCWGSNKGVCKEVGEKLGLKIIQPIVLLPFPANQLKDSLKGINRLIVVENNATGQLAGVIRSYGISVDEKILKYDGRPFSVEELEENLKKVTL